MNKLFWIVKPRSHRFTERTQLKFSEYSDCREYRNLLPMNAESSNVLTTSLKK